MKEQELQKHIDTVIAQIKTLVIVDDTGYQTAGEFLKKVKQSEKFIDEVYEPKKKEAYAPYKIILDEMKALKDKLSPAERAVKSAMGKYYNEQEQKRREIEAARRKEEEEKRLNDAIETGKEEILDKPVVIQKEPEMVKPSGTYAVDVWKYEITDKTKLKPEYLIVNEQLIGQIVRGQKEKAQEIIGEGVRVYSEKEIRQRT